MSMGPWMITIVTVVVAVCAALAALGFRGRATTVGIDLGTTFSVVGVHTNGKVVIIKDEEGHMIFPSIISYVNGGEILAGYDAVPNLSLYPDRTIFNAKRFIGRSLDESDLAEYASAHPYNVISTKGLAESMADRGGIPVHPNISLFSSVGFALDVSGHPVAVSPEQVATEVLRYLLRVTARFLGHSQVNKAVIAVPAKFTPEQRAATGMAYKAAGLKVVRVLEEPTAAAVAYDLHKKANVHNILVYDFGGGTLDVSLLYVAKGSVQVYATDGDETLGGSDFDLCLYDFIKHKLFEQSEGKVQLDSLKEGHSGSVDKEGREGQVQTEKSSKEAIAEKNKNYSTTKTHCNTANVRSMAESVKKQLSNQESVTFSCFQPLGNEGSWTSFEVTRNDFESTCSILFDRGMLPVTRLLDTLGMDRQEVDEIVLVGGTTRIPVVKERLRKYFGKELNDRIDPDITVAYGAASVLT